jgi:hypothetical protein
MKKITTSQYLLYIALIFMSCSRILVPDAYEEKYNWAYLEKGHFAFNFRPGSHAFIRSDSIIGISEAAYANILEKLELDYSDKISVFIYNSAKDAGWSKVKAKSFPWTETIKAIYAPGAKSIAVEGRAHHEIAHVITWNAIGEPGARFLSEGIATAMDSVWKPLGEQPTHLHRWADLLCRHCKLPSLITIIRELDWEFQEEIIYPISGSFVLYLLEKYGTNKFKELFIKATFDNFEKEFDRIYSVTLDSVDSEWRTYCAEYYR